MNKPGSHRGAASTKKKRYVAGDKKQPVLVIDKLRKFCNEVKLEAETNYVKNKYTKTYFSCQEIAEKFKCRAGEIAIAARKLEEENIISGLRKRVVKNSLGFNVNYDPKEEKTKVKGLTLLLSYENCPMCDSKLEVTQGFWGQNHYGKHRSSENKIVCSRTEKCKNKCYYLDASVSTHYFVIDDFKMSINNDDHISIINDQLKKVKKEIKINKRTGKYLIKLLL